MVLFEGDSVERTWLVAVEFVNLEHIVLDMGSGSQYKRKCICSIRSVAG